MNSIAGSIDLGRYQKFAEILQELPASDPDRLCHCGECDGYGHMFEGTGVRKCRALLRRDRAESLRERMAGRWEDWPPPSFAEARKKKGFVETPSFAACESLLPKIVQHRLDPVHHRPEGLALLGDYGRSKTLSPLILIKELADKDINTCDIKLPELIGWYKAGIDGRDDLRRTYRRAENSALVFVDELGQEACYGNLEHARVALNEILSRCYRMRFLILSTNLNLDGLETLFPGNLCSRLHPKAGYCRYVEDFSKRDLRQNRMF